MSVQGKTGAQSSEVIRDHLEMMKQTGMSTREAHDFTEQFLGEAEAYKDRMDEGQYKKLQTDTARFAMVQGGETGMHAKLAGRLISYARQGATAGEIEAQQAEIYRILNLGSGRTAGIGTSYVQAAGGLVAPAGQAGGMVGDMRSLAVMAMAASRTTGEGGVDTKISNFARAMTGNVGRGGTGWNEFLRTELGIKEGTTAENAMAPVFGAMEGAQAQGRDLATWLREKGLANNQMANTIVEMYRQRKEMATQLKSRDRETPASAAAGLEEAYRTRPELRQRMADAQVNVAEAEIGQQGEMAREMRTRARAELLREGKIGPRYEATAGTMESAADVARKQIFGVSHDEAMIDQRAIAVAERTLGLRVRRTATGYKPGSLSDTGSYTASNQLESDLRQAVDNPQKLYMGPDAQMHTIREIGQLLKAQGLTDQRIQATLARISAKPMAAPNPPARANP
jgi:hypothetical protein